MSVAQNKKKKLSPSAYFRLMDLCTVIFVTGVAAKLITGGNPAYLYILGLVFFLALSYLAWRGPSDEFAASCWQGAASVAFVTMVGLGVIVPYVTGFSAGMYDGFTDGYVGTPPAGAVIEPTDYIGLPFIDALVVPVSIAAFLLTFQWRRHMGLHV